MTNLVSGNRNQSIARKLVFLVLLLGISVMLIGAAARFSIFRIETEIQLQREADLIASFVKKPLQEAITRGNKAYLLSLLKDITNHDFIYRVALSYEYDGVSASISEVSHDLNRYETRLNDFRELEKSFSIPAGDNSAYLTIFSRHELFSPETTSKLAYNLAFEAAIILVITMGVLLFIKRLVIRHLNKISTFARNMSLENLSESLTLDRSPINIDAYDELDHVVEAVEHMRQSLIEDLDQRRSIELALITEQEEKLETKRLIEETKASSRAKSKFIATMSHEIRTPMNGVIGMVEMLKDTPLNEDQQRYLSVIFSSGESLLRIINDILDYSKIEAGKMSLEHIEFDLEQVINDCLKLFSATAQKCNIELVSDITLDTPIQLIGDRTRLKQILVNLVGNAIKFTVKGHVLLHVEMISEPHAWQPTIRFSIQDSGIGIKESSHTALFDAFNQADGSTTRRFGGTGLGLAICKQLVELMGGDMGLSSQLGVGSDFWFTANFRYPKQSSVVTCKPVSSILKGKRLLYIHHETFMDDSLKRHCDGAELKFHVCRTEDEALDALKSNDERFDIIVVNDQVGSSKGIDIAERIHTMQGMSGVHIVMFAGEQAVTFGHDEADYMANIIRRPLNLRDFLQTLSQIVEQQVADGEASCDVLNEKVKPELKVLVAEDNLINRMVIEGLLKKMDLVPDFCENGIETVEQCTRANAPYHVIFMDCEMPEMDGFEATVKIREWEHANSINATPIIALTAHVESEHRQRVFHVGMSYYLSKPITFEKLREAMQSVGVM